MKNKITIAALVILLLLVIWKGCQLKADHDNLLNQVSSLQTGEKFYKTKVLADSSTIASQTQTILSQDEAIKLGLLKLEGDIKKVQSQVRQGQTINIDSVPIPFVPDNFADTSGWMVRLRQGDSSKATLDSLLANSIIIPKKFSLKDKWYSIDGKVLRDGLLMDSLKISNESSVTIGWKNAGFLGLKKEPMVEIKNTNPYLNVTKMSNVVVKKKKGLLQNPIFWTGLGFLGGAYFIK
jgi:hypothetical protein